MKKVLITGASGFVGQHCLQPLQTRGFEVHAVYTKSAMPEISQVHWHRADLLHSEQVHGLLASLKPTHLLHLAWYTTPGKYWVASENVRWVQGSIDLLQAFALHGGQRVVAAGTCAEYDWKYGYCSESTTPLIPATLYGICKHAFQLILSAFAKQEGLSAAWGRLFFPFGPHEHSERLVAYVTRALLRGEPARCSHGNQVRDLLYVEDAANAFVTLLESSIQGPVNIASGCPVRVKDVATRIAAKMERKEAEALLQFGAIPDRADDPELLVANIRRLSSEVGWSPRYDLDSGLDKTIQWWKKSLVDRMEL